MKNSSNGSRKAPGNLIRVIAAPLIVTAIPVILGAGSAMAAEDATTPPDTTADRGLVARILSDHSLTIEIVVVLVGAALLLVYGHHRRSFNRRHSARGRTRMPSTHDQASSVTRIGAHPTAGDRTPGPGRPAAVGNPWMSAPPRPAAGQPLHADDHPSWPGRPGPYALHPDHPSWPGRPDPRWAATEAALQADGYPSWPGPHSRPRRDVEPSADNGEPGWPGGGGPAARRQPPPTAHRPPPAHLPPPAYRPPPARLQPVLSAPARTDFTPRADVAPRADIMPRRGPMRPGRPTGVIDRVRPAAYWVQPERVQVWDAGSVELATWIISEANQQASDIRHEARDQMTASLADARQEAAELVRKASEQATATLTAAEQEAAEIRATVTKLSTELGGVAAQVTQNLVGFATSGMKPVTRQAVQPVTEPAVQPITAPTHQPVTEPQARPAARPATQPRTEPETRPKSTPAGQPGTRPAAKPGTRPAAKPGTRPAGRAKGKPRQLRAIRVAAVATAALFVFAVGSGATELAQHGFSFFVFRQTGTGETGPSAPTDQQFLAREAAAAKAAAQKAHTPGHQSATSTSG
jgi:hypothetical protein